MGSSLNMIILVFILFNFAVAEVKIADAVLCRNFTAPFPFYRNTELLRISTPNFGMNKTYPMNTCKMDINGTTPFTFVVDYVSLAVDDFVSIYDADNANNFKVTLNRLSPTDTRVYSINAKRLTIELSATSAIGSAGFRAYFFNNKKSVGNSNLSTDTLIAIKESADQTTHVLLNKNGDLYLYDSDNSDIDIKNNGTCVFCQQNFTEPIALTSNSTSTVGQEFTIVQNKTSYMLLYRTRDPANNNFPLTTTQVTENVTTISTPWSETLYPNNVDFTQKLTFDGTQDVSLVFQIFETEENFDFLVISDGDNKVLKTLSGAKIDANGKLYPNIKLDDVEFTLTAVKSPISLRFTSNGAIGGAGYKLNAALGSLNSTNITLTSTVAPITAATTLPYPTTTPYKGDVQNFNISGNTPIAVRTAGYPDALDANQNVIWHFNDIGQGLWAMFVLDDFGKSFDCYSGVQLVVYSGVTNSPETWNILKTYDSSTINDVDKVVMTRSPGESLSVKLFSGNKTLKDQCPDLKEATGNYGFRYLIAHFNSSKLNETDSSQTDTSRIVMLNENPFSQNSVGYPAYVAPNTSQVFRYIPENEHVHMLFFLHDFGRTFDYGQVELNIYTGNTTDDGALLKSYKSTPDANKTIVSNPVGAAMTIKFTSLMPLSNIGTTVGADWIIIVNPVDNMTTPEPPTTSSDPNATTAQNPDTTTSSANTLTFTAFSTVLLILSTFNF